MIAFEPARSLCVAAALALLLPAGRAAAVPSSDKWVGHCAIEVAGAAAGRKLRIPPGEQAALGIPHDVAKPVADVPADGAACRVWVLEADAHCRATVALQSKLARPRAFTVIDVGGGLLPCEHGKYALKLAVDALPLATAWRFPSSNNRAVLQRVAPLLS